MFVQALICVAVSTAPANTGSKHKYIKIWDKKGINKTKYSQWGQRIAMFTKVVCFYNPSLLLLLMSKAKNLGPEAKYFQFL